MSPPTSCRVFSGSYSLVGGLESSLSQEVIWLLTHSLQYLRHASSTGGTRPGTACFHLAYTKLSAVAESVGRMPLWSLLSQGCLPPAPGTAGTLHLRMRTGASPQCDCGRIPARGVRARQLCVHSHRQTMFSKVSKASKTFIPCRGAKPCWERRDLVLMQF